MALALGEWMAYRLEHPEVPMRRVSLALLCLPLLALGPAPSGGPKAGPAPKAIRLDAAGKDYLRILGGAPETVTMRSGLVVLAPGKAVGRHSTEGNEEILVVLEGKGEMRLEDGTLPVEAGTALYCPPRRFHDVVNTGQGPLRYVYVVAAAGR